MNKYTLDYELIKSFTLEQAQESLDHCLSNPKIDKSLIDHPQLYKYIEPWSNTICYLEDHIRQLEQELTLVKANLARHNRL